MWRLGSCFAWRSPTFRQCLQRGSELRPVVKGRGIKIGAVRPDKRVDLGVDPNSIEERENLVTVRIVPPSVRDENQ